MGTTNCSWINLLPEIIIGAEGEGEGDASSTPTGNEGNASNQSAGDEGDGQKPPTGTPKADDDDDDDDAKDTSGLKTALQKERQAAREAQRELKKLQKAEEARSLAEKTELERAQLKEQKATERAQRLAEGLLKRDLNAAIIKAANELKFVDTDDAINGVDRSILSFDQDEDDPTNITIDAKTVERAVKALAAKKPHFLKSGTPDGQPTGSPSGGSRQTGKKTNEDILKERYPALR